MKKILFSLMFLCAICANAQNKNDTISYDIDETVEWFYKTVMPNIHKIKIVGNTAAAQEIRQRWNKVITHLDNEKGTMATEVKKLLSTPSGKEIDLNLLKEIIQVNDSGEEVKISIDIDYFINEIKQAILNVKEAAEEVAKTKK